MRIVVVTSGLDYPERLLREPRQDLLEAVLLAELPRRPWSARRIGKLFGTRTLGDIARAVRRRAARSIANAAGGGRDPRIEGWAGLAREVVPVGLLNGDRMRGVIRELRPDYLVLAETGIVSEQVLALPRVGTLNAHPAILPFARGVGVIEHALRRGVPVGVTAHFVSPGIDTGAVIRRELVPVTPGDTLSSLRHKAGLRCTRLLAELMDLAAQGQTLDTREQTAFYPYCAWPGRAETDEVARMVARGLAHDLYQRWREYYDGDVLPIWDDRHPEVNLAPVSRSEAASS